MTPLVLLDALCEFLRETVKETTLPCKKKRVTPIVYAGYLPMKDDDEEDFPYVIARIVKGNDGEKESTVKIVILIGTRAEDDDFWRDSTNLAERIRQNLLMKRIIGNQFRMVFPLELDFPEGAMPYPEAVCALNTIWQIPQPQQIIDTKEDIYGDRIPGC